MTPTIQLEELYQCYGSNCNLKLDKHHICYFIFDLKIYYSSCCNSGNLARASEHIYSDMYTENYICKLMSLGDWDWYTWSVMRTLLSAEKIFWNIHNAAVSLHQSWFLYISFTLSSALRHVFLPSSSSCHPRSLIHSDRQSGAHTHPLAPSYFSKLFMLETSRAEAFSVFPRSDG